MTHIVHLVMDIHRAKVSKAHLILDQIKPKSKISKRKSEFPNENQNSKQAWICMSSYFNNRNWSTNLPIRISQLIGRDFKLKLCPNSIVKRRLSRFKKSSKKWKFQTEIRISKWKSKFQTSLNINVCLFYKKKLVFRPSHWYISTDGHGF